MTQPCSVKTFANYDCNSPKGTLVLCNKKGAGYLAFVQPACALLWYRTHRPLLF